MTRRLIAMMMMAVLWSGAAGAAIVRDSEPPAVKAVEGDPLWRPTREQLVEWVTNGLEAAAAEMYLEEVPAIQAAIWDAGKGVAVPGGRVRFIMALTPQVVATAVGYAGAWDEGTWQGYQDNAEAAVGELVRRVALHGRNAVLVGGAGDWKGAAAVLAPIGWMDVEMGRASAARTKDGLGTGEGNATWAGRFILGQAVRHGTVDLEGVTVREGEWLARPRGRADADLVGGVGTPALDDGVYRVAVGSGEQYAWADLALE